MKMGEGWDGGIFANIAPIPTFLRCRVKKLIGDDEMNRIEHERQPGVVSFTNHEPQHTGTLSA